MTAGAGERRWVRMAVRRVDLACEDALGDGLCLEVAETRANLQAPPAERDHFARSSSRSASLQKTRANRVSSSSSA